MSVYENIKFSMLTTTCIAWQGFCYLVGRDRLDCIKNIAKYLSNKNIIYSKIFQSLSCGANILTDEEMKFLSMFNDEAPYNNNEVWNVDAMIDNVNISTNSVLRIDNVPIKSGMIALVYKGKLGMKDVVIKVKRKNIYEKLIDGIQKMEYIVKLLSYLPYTRVLSLSDVFEENVEEMLKQVDFKNEVDIAGKVYNNFKYMDDVVIPKVYPEFTTADNRIIVMDFLEGKSIRDVPAMEKYDYGKIVAKYSMKSVLYDRLYHNDLHAGNIFFMEIDDKKKIGVIDFGATGTMTRHQQNIFYSFFKEGAINKNYEAAAEVLVKDLVNPKETFEKLSSEQKLDLMTDLVRLTKDCFSAVTQMDIKLIYDLNLVLNKYNLKLSRFFCKLQLSLGIAGSVCNELCSVEGKNYMNCVEEAVKKMVKAQENMFEY